MLICKCISCIFTKLQAKHIGNLPNLFDKFMSSKKAKAKHAVCDG